MRITKDFLVNKILDNFFENYSVEVSSCKIVKENSLSISQVRDMLFTRLKNRWSKPDLFFAFNHYLYSRVFDDLFLMFGIKEGDFYVSEH